MLIHPTSKIGAWVLLFHPALFLFSFLVIDRSSSISQVYAFNVTDSCNRMTRKLNEGNAGWKSSTQAPILEVGRINILCSTVNTKCLLDNNLSNLSFGLVTTISSWQVNTTSRQGIKQLGFVLVLFFFYFPMKATRDHIHSSRGKSLAPASSWQPWTNGACC